jgi:cation diffusion facilitator CzcD-associated flavoprotein CzcO
VERLADGTWEATVIGDGVGGRIVRCYAAVAVCNGHHWDKRWPEPAYPGAEEFEGEQIHGHDYRGPEMLEGKRVLVVGGGNSGMDLARDASHVAAAAFLSLRRGVWVIRKRIDGKPIDQTLLPPWLPWTVKQKAFEYLRRRSGDPTKVGLPKPDHKVGHAHPTVSDQAFDRFAAKAVTPKPAISELRGDRVAFVDGSDEAVDLIVYCTGYRVTFPFFDGDLISAPGNDLPLFRRMLHPTIPGVYFVGLAQPLGAIMPIAEEQGRWIADLATGRYAPPSEEEMRADMRREREANEKRFYRSERHTMEIDFEEYLMAARKERARGAKRASSQGAALAARAARAELEAVA